MSEVQHIQMGKVAELRRDRPGETMAYETIEITVVPTGKIQDDHTPGSIRVHPVPLSERRVCQPVLAVDPVRPVRRFVERDQRRAVRILDCYSGLSRRRRRMTP